MVTLKVLLLIIYFSFSVSSFLHGFSLVAVRGGYFSLHCVGFSLPWRLLLQRMGSRVGKLQKLQDVGRRLYSVGSVVWHTDLVAPGDGIFPDGSNPCSLHWWVDSNNWITREVPKIVAF